MGSRPGRMGVSGYRRACFAAGQDRSREAPPRQQGNAAWLRRTAGVQGSGVPCGVGWLVAAKVPLQGGARTPRDCRPRTGRAAQFAALNVRR
jgi:hypothetical protein